MNAEETGAIESQAACEFAKAMSGSAVEGPRRLAVTQDSAKRGLGQLVLTLVELIRELLERQALRRIEAGSLTEEQIERLGATFMQLAAQMQRLKKDFDLENEDLNIDLGPLGRLL